MKDLFRGHNLIYGFHICVGAPLLMVVPIIYIIHGEVDKKIMEIWLYILFAVGAAMFAYHCMKLGKNLDVF